MNTRAASVLAVLALSALAFPAVFAVSTPWKAACGADVNDGASDEQNSASALKKPFNLDRYSGAPGSYLCNVKMYCELQVEPMTPRGDGKNLRAVWDVANASDMLLSWHDPKAYPEVAQLSDVSYLDPSGALGNGIGTAVSDAVSCTPDEIYRKAMNSAFNCAVWGGKHAIHTQVTELVQDQKFKDFIKKVDKKVVDKLTGQTGSTANASAPACGATACTGLSDATGATLSPRLANEATYQQCVYRFYLLYVDQKLAKEGPKLLGDKFSSYSGSVAESVNAFVAGSGALAADMFPGIVSNLRAAVRDRDARAVRSYLAAVAAYQEFARTYGPHILLQLIDRDYVRIRDAMDVMMTPVSQALFKATNAMSAKGAPGGK